LRGKQRGKVYGVKIDFILANQSFSCGEIAFELQFGHVSVFWDFAHFSPPLRACKTLIVLGGKAVDNKTISEPVVDHISILMTET
jgi:hypothetical protein